MFCKPTLWRYFLGSLAGPVTGAVVLLLSLTWVLQSTRFLDLLLNKGLSFGVFLHLTALLFPFLLQFILPLGFFAGITAFFKRLNDESELAPLFAAGLSPAKLLRPVFFATLCVVAVGYAISLLIMPVSMTAFKDMQHRLRHQEGHIFLETGTFNQLGEGLMIYLKRRTGQYGMQGLLVHDSRKAEAPTTWMAQAGEIQRGANGSPQLTLEHGIRQDISQEHVTMLEFDKHTLELSFAMPPASERSRALEEYTLPELRELESTYTKKERREVQAEIQKRLLWPLTPIVFMMIAAAALLQPTIRRGGVTRGVILGSMAAIGYQLLLIVAQNTIHNGIVGVLQAQWALPVLFIIGSIYVLNKSCERR